MECETWGHWHTKNGKIWHKNVRWGSLYEILKAATSMAYYLRCAYLQSDQMDRLFFHILHF